ncbi:hypothetical protein BH09ACT8_BH09ACT8_59130 [soil metagenome]
MTDTQAPPFHWINDQARAWRVVAAIREHDGLMFETVVAEARNAGPEAVDKLLAALARNLVVRLRLTIGMDELDELIDAELRACAAETDTQAGQ